MRTTVNDDAWRTFTNDVPDDVDRRIEQTREQRFVSFDNVAEFGGMFGK